jgi:uncharacterized protein YdaT
MAKWRERIDIADAWHAHDAPFEQRRDAIVSAIKASAWYARSLTDGTLELLVEELEAAKDGDEFDGPMSSIYDLADDERVWVGP